MSAPAPLTQREEEMLEIRRNEVQTDVSTETRQKTLGGISCALTEAASAAIRDAAKGTYNYLQFKIELKEEKIHLVKAINVDIAKLPKEIPDDEARYHIYLFKHTHEGDYLESFVFIYSMPGYKCPVKERMMYSSCKAPFIETIKDLGLNIEKKVSVRGGNQRVNLWNNFSISLFVSLLVGNWFWCRTERRLLPRRIAPENTAASSAIRETARTEESRCQKTDPATGRYCQRNCLTVFASAF